MTSPFGDKASARAPLPAKRVSLRSKSPPLGAGGQATALFNRGRGKEDLKHGGRRNPDPHDRAPALARHPRQRRFLDHQVSQPERRAVVRHLIAQCPQCLGLVGRIDAEGGYWFGKEVAAGLAEGDRFLASFEAATAFVDRESRQLACEHLRGWGHWSALDPLLPPERLPAVIAQTSWHHWGLFRALLDAARWYSSRDPQEAADIAQLAIDIM
jgi:hypothetical protein